jgi:putative transposase
MKYGGIQASDLKRLKETEAELSKYKKMYAELAHENYALQVLVEKTLGLPEKRRAAEYLVAEKNLRKTMACSVVKLSRSSMYRRTPSSEQQDKERCQRAE